MLEIPWRRAVARCGLRGSDGIQGAANFCGAGGLTAAFRAGDGLADIFSSPRCHNGVQMMPAQQKWTSVLRREKFILNGFSPIFSRHS